MSELAPPPEARDETELQRSDRHLAELMQEVRVAQMAVQVLFAFLLTVPLTAGFAELADGERRLYFVTLALAGTAAILLIAPTAHHRILFRCNEKAHIVRMANRYLLVGLTFAALAMVGAISFVGAVVFSAAAGAGAGAGAALLALWCWYLQPLIRRRRAMRRAEDDEQRPAGLRAA